jgi:hypothetical protein
MSPSNTSTALPEQQLAKSADIFPPWHFDRWRAVDDRVRGGSSISHLDRVECDSRVNSHEVMSEKESTGHSAARFWGNLGTCT